MFVFKVSPRIEFSEVLPAWSVLFNRPGCILCRLPRRSLVWMSKSCGVLAYDHSRRILTGVQMTCFILCGSRKYPYPHHGGNWKFQRGGGVKGPGNSGEEEGGGGGGGGLLVN